MDQVAASLVEATRTLDLKRHLCVLPLATLLENVAGVYAPLQLGSEICLPSLAQLGWTGAARLNARALLACMTEYEPDSVILVPQLLTSLLDAIAAGATAPASLKFIAVGGGHVAPATLERAEQIGLPVYVGYGLTEAASVVTFSSPKQRRQGSVGRPLAHANVRIDANSEVFVSGASYCGYAGQPTVPSDEVATGDLGRLDADGFLYILGRRKNIFITSFGRNVDPEWVAAEFSRQPTIAQIAVFGEARPWNVAVIVPEPGANHANLGAEIAAVNATLPDYAQIGRWIVADEDFTLRNGLLTGNGRCRRAAIWAAYRHQIEACYDCDVAQRA
jgi:long-subunit acyl-CoA synthetase (AMP-forming)